MKAHRKSSLTERCYEMLRRIPKGKVVTYKLLSKALGTKGYRAIGGILGRNPDAPHVPCHRVVRTDGGLGGYSASGGIKEKIRLLRKEGIKIERDKVIDLDTYLHRF